MDITTEGKVTGSNPDHSKLVSLDVKIKAGEIDCRKFRADLCELESDKIAIGSSLEALDLDLRAGSGGLFVKKRLGLNQMAKIRSSGIINVSSLFARMFDLPQPE